MAEQLWDKACRKKWLGETVCNICNKPCGEFLFDGATIHGPWAVMCSKCHLLNGRGVGQGVGQKYQKVDGPDYFKVAG